MEKTLSIVTRGIMRENLLEDQVNYMRDFSSRDLRDIVLNGYVGLSSRTDLQLLDEYMQSREWCTCSTSNYSQLNALKQLLQSRSGDKEEIQSFESYVEAQLKELAVIPASTQQHCAECENKNKVIAQAKKELGL